MGIWPRSGCAAAYAERLAAGSKFGMQMHWGVPDKILNDPAGSRARLVLRLMGASRRNQRSIEETLARLEAWALVR